MALRRADGSVYSENTPSRDFDQTTSHQGVYRVLLTEILYADNVKNIYSKTASPCVVYNGVTIGGKSEGQSVSNIRDALAPTGELNNFGERIYRVCSTPITGASATPLNKQDGSIVYVVFVNGNPNFPIIVGRDKAGLDRAVTGAKKADGPIKRWQHNGIFFSINKNGELTLKRKGGKFNEKTGNYIPVDTGDEAFLNWTENKMVLNIGKDAIKETRNGPTELVTLEFKSGLKITYDGKNDAVTILTKGGAKTLVDGKNDAIKIDTTGGSHAYVDGKSGTIELKDNGTGKLKITGDKVALGASSAELLQQVSDSLQKIITWANSVGAIHVHIGNLGYPTAPPTQASGYTSLGSDLSTIKGKVDGIKGTL